MTEPAETWAKQLQDLTGDSDEKSAAEFVRDLYECAQNDLDDQRAQAEYEREE
ncbi:hypothetical protein [Streptomyces sp. NBC_01190]|uniref:hypothetical protein n=1 Tax=Streptomyces sp. NBC_01190 TaxID=2903767 RepID=UPI00386824D7|nr:hypothetical protein OG519_02715 [Streptomyces sp. NBC_01190]